MFKHVILMSTNNYALTAGEAFSFLEVISKLLLTNTVSFLA